MKSESIYLATGLYRFASKHLVSVENYLMGLKNSGAMTATAARAWIAANIAPLEKRYESGERGEKLLHDIAALTPPEGIPEPEPELRAPEPLEDNS